MCWFGNFYLQVLKLKKEVILAKKRCAKADERVINSEISKLPPTQQEAVRTCFSAAKRPQKGRRYTQQWVYECLLMRIKSKKLYQDLRRRQILPLPHIDTLNKYVKRMGSAYGFNLAIFNLLSMKAQQLTREEKRGRIFHYLLLH